jgi:hypothetical protein
MCAKSAERWTVAESIAPFEMVDKGFVGTGPCSCGTDDGEVIGVVAAEVPDWGGIFGGGRDIVCR